VGRELGDDAGERDGFQPVMVLDGDDDAGRPAILADCGQPLDDLGLRRLVAPLVGDDAQNGRADLTRERDEATQMVGRAAARANSIATPDCRARRAISATLAGA